MTLYKGFWTGSYLEDKKKGFSTSDVETVNRDLLNHIFTIKGERVMLPNFGTRIPDLAFEPLDQKTIDIVREDLNMVIKNEPRVRLIDMLIQALPDNNAIVAIVELEYLELDISQTIRIDVPVGG